MPNSAAAVEEDTIPLPQTLIRAAALSLAEAAAGPVLAQERPARRAWVQALVASPVQSPEAAVERLEPTEHPEVQAEPAQMVTLVEAVAAGVAVVRTPPQAITPVLAGQAVRAAVAVVAGALVLPRAHQVTAATAATAVTGIS